mmetsp:Transcript_5082/g.7878  ORF Transcript_5082/g.7878 Transcript_5082/m.7878 type:complete len:595 (-) Transcript_5082:83-1867(-)
MEIVYSYTRQRRNFGRQVSFKDKPAELLESIPPVQQPTGDAGGDFIVRNPTVVDVQCAQEQSEHDCNTERFELASTGILHKEGGWPKDVDSSEIDQCIRYRKKIEKDDDYIRTVDALSVVVEQCLKQNLSLDIYQEYFSGTFADHSSEPPSARTLTVFRDPNAVKRTATSISWYPDAARKLAVSYSILQFQQTPDGMSPNSYVWDITNPNYPEQELVPSSPLCCLEYNPKDGHVLVGGSYNGLVAFWDTRKGSAPVETSPIEKSHRDPVYDVAWLQPSKTGTECASVSTDGQVFWWDIRKLGEPTESLLLDIKGDGVVLGGVTLCYDAAGGPTKFMVGTEQGMVLSCNRKSKNPTDRIGATYAGHHGPIYALERHPFYPKYFLTIGDWTSRIWMEDLRTPIMTTKYHNSYLTDGCWSPTRPGVFFTTKIDGSLDIWDYFFKQNDPTLSLQVCDGGLHSLRVQDHGKLVAVGSNDGTTTLLELCDGLCVPQQNEKQSILQMLERETKREKNLETRAKEMRLKAKKPEDERKKHEGHHSREIEDAIKSAEADFYAATKADNDADVPVGPKASRRGGAAADDEDAVVENDLELQDTI